MLGRSEREAQLRSSTGETMPPSWEQLVSVERLTPSTVHQDPAQLRNNCASDRGRVLHCPSFRRLQAKAQVFSLDEGSFVRNRLTHSLEVAHNGIEIARLVADELLRNRTISGDNAKQIADAIVLKTEVACLVHDIGNPPFGHFGEAAIKSWFSSKPDSSMDDNGKSPGNNAARSALSLNEADVPAETMSEILADFEGFDGNPQGFRILTRLALSDFRQTHGLNLTTSQLLSCIKYPPSPARPQKLGVFSTEAKIYEDCCAAVGLTPGARHPIAYLMDAADDISYCISDIEDGIDQGLIRAEDFTKHIRNIPDTLSDPNQIAQVRRLIDYSVHENSLSIIKFKAVFVRMMIDRAKDLFISDYTNIIQHGNARSLFHGEAVLLDGLKQIAEQKLFVNQKIEGLELSGYHTITGILNRFKPILQLPQEKFELLIKAHTALSSTSESADDLPKMLKDDAKLGTHAPVLWRLFHLLPEKHLTAYKVRLLEIESSATTGTSTVSRLEWIARAHLIVDFVSGMTDKFAVETYQRLSGVRL